MKAASRRDTLSRLSAATSGRSGRRCAPAAGEPGARRVPAEAFRIDDGFRDGVGTAFEHPEQHLGLVEVDAQVQQRRAIERGAEYTDASELRRVDVLLFFKSSINPTRSVVASTLLHEEVVDIPFVFVADVVDEL
jgi:hypothetical protein